MDPEQQEDVNGKTSEIQKNLSLKKPWSLLTHEFIPPFIEIFANASNKNL